MDLTKKANAMRDKVRERVRSDVCVCVHYVGVYKERERVHVCVCQESMWHVCMHIVCEYDCKKQSVFC